MKQRRPRVGSASIVVFMLVLGACASPPGGAPAPAPPSSSTGGFRHAPAGPVAEPHPVDASTAAAGTPDTPPAPPAPTRDIVLVTDRAALHALAAAGADLGSLLHGAPAASNRELAAHRAYEAMVRVLAGDLDAIARTDPDAGVGVRGNVHRLFDTRWLRSPRARFELVAVAHRIDLAAVRSDACGEVHLLYRLAYTAEVAGEPVSSRLPMTLVVVLPGAPARGFATLPSAAGARGLAAGCAEAARRWRAPAALDGHALGEWLARGPLAGALDHDCVEAVRVNMQSVRWPSAVRPDLGGHAEYILRVFYPDDERGMREAPLENTPDVARIRANPALRARLLAWIAEALAGIDDGTARMPEELAARRSVSVTPRGLSRRGNRPFRQIFAPRDLAGLDLAGRALVGSPEALLRRLDDLSCAGCHQSRAIAGFHALGEDAPDTAPGNALMVPLSPHLQDEIARRTAISAALAEGRPASFARPFAERGPGDPGALGSRCAAPLQGGGVDPGFRAWTCAPGFSCAAYDVPGDDAVVGTCLPDGDMDIGGPCEFGPIASHRDPHRDRARNRAARSCASGAVCNVNRTGFPGGMCTASCSDVSGLATCGVIALLEPFNNCLAQSTPFPRCLAEHVTPAGLRACDAASPCRDDYICARMPGGSGACIPPYFVFQMRVDGHP